MNLKEISEARLRSAETASLVNAKELMRVFALASSVLVIPNALLPASGVYQGYTRTTSDSFRTVRVTHSTQESRPKPEVKASLAQRLLALRAEAISKGMPLLSQDEVLAEVRRRRDENV